MVMSPYPSECGHAQMISCGEDSDININRMCTKKCDKILRCGHDCRLICGAQCLNGKLHGPCTEPCERQLVCGHDWKGKQYFGTGVLKNTFLINSG